MPHKKIFFQRHTVILCAKPFFIRGITFDLPPNLFQNPSDWHYAKNKTAKKIIYRPFKIYSAANLNECHLIKFVIPARMLHGFACGGITSAAPVLLAEISTAEQRSRNVTMSLLVLVFGEFVVFVIGGVMGNIWYDK
jgi:MFS family permease